MKGKQTISTELHPGGGPRVNGSGDTYRISVDQNVMSGPAGTVGRRVTLIMDTGIAVDLTVAIFGRLPALTLGSEEYAGQMKRLRQYIAMTDSAPKSEKPEAPLDECKLVPKWTEERNDGTVYDQSDEMVLEKK